MKAMIFAAGLGTRLKPLTDNKPKALVEIDGISLLERSINYLKSYQITEIVVNTHHFEKQIVDFIQAKDNFGIDIHISNETNELLDTGGAILKAKDLLSGKEPILLINVDILTNLDLNTLLNHHLKNQALASLVVRNRDTSRYLLFDDEKQLVGWKNSKTNEIKVCGNSLPPSYSPYAFSGIQIIQPQLLELINESGKFSIIDLYLRLAKSEKIKAFIDKQSTWMDLGKFEEIEEAEKLARQISNN